MDAIDLLTLAQVRPEHIYHVYPVGDLREHVTDNVHENGVCGCDPELQIEGAGVVIVHNSLDGREAFETGKRKPS
jgi:hypothetical protein